MTPCDTCKIRKNCDWLSIACPATPAEIAQMPHLIKPMNRYQKWLLSNDRTEYWRERYEKQTAPMRAAIADLDARIAAYIRGERAEI